MKQATIQDIINIINRLEFKGMTYMEIMKLPIYIGNDEELNGIHCGWGVELVDTNDKDYEDIVQMINEDFGNIKIKEKAILIS